ncbi:alpha/beta hydrolase [Texcoconibacillus texcoconensis]|uniref:Alpha-beta hydrolase superfamily lysophospholipase n=1 Tax=Texcoconibacillus texcoconensis TaxID=1095777 RepID=A0A840QT14_9BACI|nr:alpha/beta hydrolase [Texcoconibacillus texcoconensis]MBB5174505.1 alpha-beta hydrolase superfamily lysophospholipase [Texcoconibacillus texcoconensis]
MVFSEDMISHIQQQSFHFKNESDPLNFSYISDYLKYYGFQQSLISSYFNHWSTVHGEKIFVQVFIPEKVKSYVVVAHGYLDHTGGISLLVNDLLKNGYAVYIYDQWGHGLSSGKSADLEDFQIYIDVLQTVYHDLIEYGFPAPQSAIGHSTGAAILFHGACQRLFDISSLILVAPLYHPYKWKYFQWALPFIAKQIKQKKRAYRKNSSSHQYLSFVESDPLQTESLHTNWLLALRQWQERISTEHFCSIPTYIIQGTKDTTVHWKENLSFFTQATSTLQIALVEGGRHQLLNERKGVRQLVFERILTRLS